jgi:hypothetical protein
VRLGVAGELDPEQIGDFALVPSHERADPGDARNGAARDAPPDEEVLVRGTARDIPQLEPTRTGVPRIDHLHSATALDQAVDRIVQILRLHRNEIEPPRRRTVSDFGACRVDEHRRAHGAPAPGDSAWAIDVR